MFSHIEIEGFTPSNGFLVHKSTVMPNDENYKSIEGKNGCHKKRQENKRTELKYQAYKHRQITSQLFIRQWY